MFITIQIKYYANVTSTTMILFYIVTIETDCTCSIDAKAHKYFPLRTQHQVNCSSFNCFQTPTKIEIISQLLVDDFHHLSSWIMGNLHGIVTNMLDCNIVVSKFKLQRHYYVHFRTNRLGKDMTLLILSSFVLNSTTTVLLEG